MTKMLLIGKDGQVGYELRRTLASLGQVYAPGVDLLDLTKPEQIKNIIQTFRPEVIINAAAYTQVDKAEEETEAAMMINGTAPGIIAEEAKQVGACMIHYSTDYVFDGRLETGYCESDTPNPINVYGKTKLAGEQAVAAANIPYLILRTSWVYGGRGQNFLLTILRLANEREELAIVDDQIGSPTWSRLIAESTAQILSQQIALKQPCRHLEACSGLYHLTASNSTSWHGFAEAFLALDPQAKHHKLRSLKPIPSVEYPTPAARPQHSTLNTQKLQEQFGLTMPDWQDSLKLLLESA